MAEPAPRPKVLIVEDEFLIRVTLAESLTEEGFEVAEAASGEEARAILAGSAPISLLLTDIQLPGALNGLDLARSAREERPDLPVIFVTGQPEAMPGPVRAAGDVFVPKPYVPAEVAAIARRLTAK
jgi:CheY-like chemotaxis protein